MKTSTLKTFVYISLAAGVTTLNSCKKANDTVIPTTGNAQETYKQLPQLQSRSTEFNLELQSIASKFVNSKLGYFKTDDYLTDLPCVTVTRDTLSSPKTAIVDFGAGCADPSGKFYSGSFKVEYNNQKLDTQGSYMLVTFNNFKIDSMIATGTVEVKNLGLNGSGRINGTLELNTTCTFVKQNLQIGGAHLYNIEHFDADKQMRTDAYLMFNGSGNGKTSNGINFKQKITSSLKLVQNTGCSKYFVAGNVLFQTPSMPDKTTDYGSGSCDNAITVTENGVTTTVILTD